MSVRAKFRVNALEYSEGSRPRLNPDGTRFKDEQGREVWEPCELVTIKAAPVYGNGDPNHENTKFWQASPSGSLHLGTVNADAAKQFVLGGEYYVDFTPAA